MITAATVDAPYTAVDDHDILAIRACLKRIADHERPQLWSAIDFLRHALLSDDSYAANRIIAAAPDGPIRSCLLRVALPFLRARRQPGPPADRHVQGRARTGSLYRGFEGVAGPVEQWSSARTGLYYEKVDADAYSAVPTDRVFHEPVPINYGHAPALVVGCSRRWSLAGDGSLCMEGEFGSWPAAQQYARQADAGQLGLSVEMVYRTRWLAHPAPGEWDPTRGVVDLCHRDQAHIEAVALVTRPAFDTAVIRRVW